MSEQSATGRIALAAPHTEAVAAGRRAIAAGGNAIDAALAAAVMLTVVYPHQCSLGGDLIAVLRAPDGTSTAVVSAGTAPRRIRDAAAGWTSIPKQGVHTVTVPGAVAGWMALARAGGRLELADFFADAAEAAESGTPVSAGLERAIDVRRDAVVADPGLSTVFAPNGHPLRAGDLLRQPALAATLRRLASDPSDFYTGDIAHALLDGLRELGGVHEPADFAAFEPEVAAALQRDVAGATWSVAPPPSVGAILVGMALAAGTDATKLVPSAVRGVESRRVLLGDPAFSHIDVEALLALAAAPSASSIAEPPASGDTVAIAAVDENGWAVTIVQSVYQAFGSGILEPRTGIVLHNRGSAFSLDPDSPALLRPGSRPPHTLCPVIVERDDLLMAVGSQGGRSQPWILAQVLPGLLEIDVDARRALAAPRWVIGDTDLGRDRLTFVAEPGVRAEYAEQARSSSLPTEAFPDVSDAAGHVQAVRRVGVAGGFRLDAASDPRADGEGIVAEQHPPYEARPPRGPT